MTIKSHGKYDLAKRKIAEAQSIILQLNPNRAVGESGAGVSFEAKRAARRARKHVGIIYIILLQLYKTSERYTINALYLLYLFT